MQVPVANCPTGSRTCDDSVTSQLCQSP